MEVVERLTAEHGVVIFSAAGCCVCYSLEFLFEELGVTPHVHDVDADPRGGDIRSALAAMRFASGATSSARLPAVFIGGKLVGWNTQVMGLHVSGELLPLIRPYRR